MKEIKREIIYLSLHCHHQNDPCIKMDSDKSHFNVSLMVRDNVTRQCPHTTNFEEKGEPKRIRTEVPRLTSLSPDRYAKTTTTTTTTTKLSLPGHYERKMLKDTLIIIKYDGKSLGENEYCLYKGPFKFTSCTALRIFQINVSV